MRQVDTRPLSTPDTTWLSQECQIRYRHPKGKRVGAGAADQQGGRKPKAEVETEDIVGRTHFPSSVKDIVIAWSGPSIVGRRAVTDIRNPAGTIPGGRSHDLHRPVRCSGHPYMSLSIGIDRRQQAHRGTVVKAQSGDCPPRRPIDNGV